MASRKNRRELRVFVVMPREHREVGRVHALLTEVASQFRDPELDLIFTNDALSTHALLTKNLHRFVAAADVVLCFTDGRDPDVSFEAGVAFGLKKPLVVVILPGTWAMPETFAGHYYVELAGDSSDRECLRATLASVAEGLMPGGRAGGSGSIGLPRFSCALGRSGA